jgi:hypothetical protein
MNLDLSNITPTLLESLLMVSLMPRLLTSVNVAVLECYGGLKKEINEKYKKRCP